MKMKQPLCLQKVEVKWSEAKFSLKVVLVIGVEAECRGGGGDDDNGDY